MKIVFLGGRQAEVLCRAYRRGAPAEHAVGWLDAGRDLSRAQEDQLASADWLALQATGAPLRVDLDAIEAKGERIWFPKLSLDFLWPFGGQPHFANTMDDVFSTGPFPIEIGDAYLNRKLQSRDRPEAILEAYLALDVAKIVDLDAYKQMVLGRQKAIDALCGSDFASRLEREYQARSLFANPLTPGVDLLRAIAEPLFARLPGARAVAEDLRLEEWSLLEAPVHPSVAAHFELSWAKDRVYRTWTGEGVDFAEYVRRYLAYVEGPELESGIRLAASGASDEAVTRLQRGLARPIAARSVSGRRAITRAFATSSSAGVAAPPASMVSDDGLGGDELTQAFAHLSLGRAENAEASALAFLAKTPQSIEAWLLLARIREKTGDGAGRIAALRQAIELRAGDASLQSRLTLAFAEMGEWRGAAESAEREVAINPENPHARAFLAAAFERLGEGERANQQIARALEIISAGPQYAELRNELQKRRKRTEPDTAAPL